MNRILLLIAVIVLGSVSPDFPAAAPVIVLIDGTIPGGEHPPEAVGRFKREILDVFGTENVVGSRDGRMVAVRSPGDSWFLLRDWKEPDKRTPLRPAKWVEFLDHGHLVITGPDGDYVLDTATTSELPLPVKCIAIAAAQSGLFVALGKDDWTKGRPVIRIWEIVEGQLTEKAILEYDVDRMFTRLVVIPGGKYFLFCSGDRQTVCSTLEGRVTDTFEGVLYSSPVVGHGRFALTNDLEIEVGDGGQIGVVGRFDLYPDSCAPDRKWHTAYGEREGEGPDASNIYYLIDAGDRKKKWVLSNRLAFWLSE